MNFPTVFQRLRDAYTKPMPQRILPLNLDDVRELMNVNDVANRALSDDVAQARAIEVAMSENLLGLALKSRPVEKIKLGPATLTCFCGVRFTVFTDHSTMFKCQCGVINHVVVKQ